MRILNVGLMIGNPENGFQKAMRKVATGGYMDMPCHSGTHFNSDLLQAAKDFKPTIIFMQFQQPNILHEHTAKELAQISFVINFSGDVREELPQWYLDIGKHIQLTCFSNMVDVMKCRAVGGVNSEYLEIGVDENIFYNRNLAKQSPSIIAHFNHYENMFPLSQYRVDVVNALRNEFGSEFGLYGNGWSSCEGNFNHSQSLESENYNRCRVAISVSHFNYNRYASDRLLRILASGAFCLSHSYDGIELDYIVGKHLDTFDNIEELIKKCKYYLANDQKREAIAKNGMELIHKNHTFEAMCKNIISLYKSYK